MKHGTVTTVIWSHRKPPMPRKFEILNDLETALLDQRRGEKLIPEALCVILQEQGYPPEHLIAALAFLATHQRLPSRQEFNRLLDAPEARLKAVYPSAA